MRSWHNRIIAILIVAAIADVAYGLGAVLKALSIISAIGLIALVVVSGTGAIFAVSTILMRDAIEEIATDRRHGRPWRWRCVGWIGIIGMLVDGLAGAWSAYQEDILFSAAVAQIPLAGVPVFLALGSYPLKWIEVLLIKRFASNTIAA